MDRPRARAHRGLLAPREELRLGELDGAAGLVRVREPCEAPEEDQG